MALEATIYKATLKIADMDRNLYADHEGTIARHPSETDERMLVRLLVFALHVPEEEAEARLEFAKDMWEAEEPALCEKDFTGRIRHWIEVGQPEDKPLLKACNKADAVVLYTYGSAAEVWWRGIEGKLIKAHKLSVWRVPSDTAQRLAALAQRSMQLQATIQEGQLMLSDSERTVEVEPLRWKSSP